MSTLIAAAPMQIHDDVMRFPGATGRASSLARTIVAVSRYCISPMPQQTRASTCSRWLDVNLARPAAATATDWDPTAQRNQVPLTWSNDASRRVLAIRPSGIP